MKKIMLSILLLLMAVQMPAQISSSFDEFRQEINGKFQDFRKKINKDYNDFVRNAWRQMGKEAPIPAPVEETVPPVVMPEKEVVPPLKDKPVIVLDVVKPVKIEEQPAPAEPIKEIPVLVAKKVNFTFFGTEGWVRFDKTKRIRLSGHNEDAIADGLNAFAEKDYDNLIIDCLALRESLQLSDWAYLHMLKAMADAVYGQGTNEATLLMAYVYCQSGYQMRLAREEQGKLVMLYASNHNIYGAAYFNLDDTNYYPFGDCGDDLFICQAEFPKEKPMSLLITKEQKFDMAALGEVKRESKRYPEMSTTVVCNKNLLDFYATYPTSVLGDNVCSRWAMYANTPFQSDIKEQIYPVLKEAIRGKSELEAVNMLLNYVQTGFAYDYDDNVWGHDRAFFAEESLNYPFCDCEDRSILLTRLVRDLVGLKCVLVYYPGHLASAVCFNEQVSGDYIQLGNRRFYIADGTYINAPVGHTMKGMDNASAQVIVLE